MQIALKLLLSGIVILVAYYSIQRVWTSDVDIRKWFGKPSEALPLTPKTKKPLFEVGLTVDRIRYQPGAEVQGVIWRTNYRRYQIRVRSAEGCPELENLRIRLLMPGYVVSYQLEETAGCEGLSVFQKKDIGAITGKGSVVARDTFDFWVNDFFATATHFQPRAYFGYRLIVGMMGERPECGYFMVKCRYKAGDGQEIDHNAVYRMKFRSPDSDALYVDLTTPVEGSYKAYALIVPKEQLLFGKDGSVRIEGEERSPQQPASAAPAAAESAQP